MGGRGGMSFTTQSNIRDIESRMAQYDQEMAEMERQAEADAVREIIDRYEFLERYGYLERMTDQEVLEELRSDYDEEKGWSLGQQGYGIPLGKRKQLQKELDAIHKGQRSLFG